MKIKKSALTNRIIAFARTKPDGFTPADVKHFGKGKHPSSVHVALYTLKQRGVLSHDNVNGVYKLAVTPVKKNTNKPPAQPVRDVDAETIAHLAQQVVDNSESYKRLQERYNDALAIIRYLENKLFVLIQHTNEAR